MVAIIFAYLLISVYQKGCTSSAPEGLKTVDVTAIVNTATAYTESKALGLEVGGPEFCVVLFLSL